MTHCWIDFKGVFTPIVHLLWSESVDELADSVRFLLAWFDFTHAKCQTNQNLSTKSLVKAVAGSLVTNHMGFAGGEFVFFWDMSRYSYHPGTAHSERVCSRARAEWPCACCVWAAALISVYFSVLNSISLALPILFFSYLLILMHSAAGYRSWFSPTMRNACCTWVGLRSDHVHSIKEPHQG